MRLTGPADIYATSPPDASSTESTDASPSRPGASLRYVNNCAEIDWRLRCEEFLHERGKVAFVLPLPRGRSAPVNIELFPDGPTLALTYCSHICPTDTWEGFQPKLFYTDGRNEPQQIILIGEPTESGNRLFVARNMLGLRDSLPRRFIFHIPLR